MSFDLLLPFLRPIEPLLLDDGVSEIMGNPDGTWWYERDGIIRPERSVRFPFEEQETLLKLLSITFGGDPACTDCNRVLRLPGFLNRKYTPAPLVTVEYPRGSAAHCEDFKLADPRPYPDPSPGRIEPLMPTGKHSHSEQDWAWILGELAGGKDPVRLTRTLAERRPDKPNPVYYAQRTVDVASAWLWLRDGFPIADVVTMLQARRRFQVPDKLCSARAHEIAFTAERMIARKAGA